MKRVKMTRVATRPSIAVVRKTALAATCGGKLVRLMEAEPSSAAGTEDGPNNGELGWMKLW